MQHGEVKERGTHQQLIEMNGIYKNLVSRQLVSEELDKENEAGEEWAHSIIDIRINNLHIHLTSHNDYLFNTHYLMMANFSC